MASKSKGYGAANILVEKVEAVSVRGLKMFHKNPRVGNVDKIAESLRKNGQFKPIVVNTGTKTGRPMEILAGNHTWLGTKRNGDDLILAAFVDVDDDTATRINLADNKTADEGSYDDTILAELLASLPDAIGTGYNAEEFDNLIASLGDMADTPTDADDIPDAPSAEDLGQKPTFEDVPLGEEEDAEGDPVPTARELAEARERAEEEAKRDSENDLDSKPSWMKGIAQLGDMDLEEVGTVPPWGIPKLRVDRLMTPEMLPDHLDSWAGSATRDWPNEEQWWLYNYGVDSTSGMRDISKVILAFYTYDDYFEKWWDNPSKYTTKVINSRIKYICSPDFSCETHDPTIVNLYQLYRSRWLSRYFQEAGLYLLPHLIWPDGNVDFLRDFVLPSMPKGVRMIVQQLQTFDPDKVEGGLERLKEQFDLVHSTLKDLEVLVLYAGNPGYEWYRDNVEYGDCRIIRVGTRQEKLSEKAKGKARKDTL